MTSAIIEVKRIDGKPAHRLEGSPAGAWIVAESEIDAILNRVKQKLGVNHMQIYDATEIPSASVTRCRQGKVPLQDKWLLRLSDYSGIPVAELRRVACVEPTTHPHPKAAA